MSKVEKVEYDWDTIISQRMGGTPWRAIAEEYGVSPATIRKAFSREKERFAAAEGRNRMRILAIDIETAPHTAYVWRMWDENISTDQVLETGRVMCFVAKWVDDPFSPPEFWSEHHHSHKEMVEAAYALLDEADAVLHYNGSKFDIPMLNREFLKLGMAPPAPYVEIDLLKTIRRRFRFGRNALDAVLRELKIGAKVKHRGFTLWVDCMNGDAEAWEEMKEYNLADVAEMVKLYNVVLPWITSHPNHALYQWTDRPTCTNCGGNQLQKRGYAFTKTQKYRRYQCTGCGTWVRKRYTAVEPDKRADITTQVV